MNLSITADSAEELKAKVLNLAAIFGHSSVEMVPAQTSLPIPEEKTPRKRAPKAKVEAVKEAREEVSQVEAAHPAQPSAAPADNKSIVTDKPNRDAVVAALQKVHETKGLPVAREVLAKFSCARISEVKEDQYPAFIQACNEVAS